MLIILVTLLWLVIGSLVLMQQFQDLAELEDFGTWKQIFTTIYILSFGPIFAVAGILEEFLNVIIGVSEGDDNNKGGFV